MKKQNKILLQFLFLFLILLFSYKIYNNFSEESVKIANWNLQIFGEKKASDEKLMNFYVDKIQDYDIIFLQEIRDSSGNSFVKLCNRLQNYSCEISSRAGRSNSKEQYGIIYKNGINLTNFYDYNLDSDANSKWERPPIKADFRINGYSVSIYNIHTKPEDTPNEISNLERVIEDKDNILILGDLNADCNYYSDNFSHFNSWYWKISDDEDTTSSNSDCAYDRIILNENSNKEHIKSGIDSAGITNEVSDHYLIWVELNLKDKDLS